MVSYAQTPIKQFVKEHHDSLVYPKFAHRKIIPKEIREQALIALYFYPELKDVDVVFRYRKTITPLSSRPQVLSAFKKSKNRTYIITISTKSNKKLSPILLSNLPYNAQIGVLGHELGHVAYYNGKNTGQLLGLFYKIWNTKFVDKFEFNTDLIAIDHGLGYQLYDWSAYVRSVLNVPEWRGASDKYPTKEEVEPNQRYMNPETIEKFMESKTIYGAAR